MRIAILDLYHQFHYETVEKICKEDGLTISYALTGTRENSHGDLNVIESISSQLFGSKVMVETVIAFLYPDFVVTLSNEDWLLDEKIIRECKHIESISLRTSDRNTAFPISVQDRRQYYLVILNHFYKIITENTITHLLAFDTPHSYFSTIFHELAKYLNLPVIRMEYHFLPNHSLLIDKYDFPKIPVSFRPYEDANQLFHLLPKSVQAAYEQDNKFIESLNKREKSKIISKGAFSQTRIVLRFVKRKAMNVIMGIFPFLFKKEILHFASLNNIKNRFRYRALINIPLWSLLQLNHYYNKLSTEPDLDKKYVFFGMHMQPEKTSQPLGREFDNQLIPIKILAQSVPEGWMIYVKEHPNQFNDRKIVNNNYRSKLFYDAIDRIENVALVPLAFPSSDLIAKAQVVSTLTGTLGWEALKVGKCVINFGDPYYQACEATRRVDSVTGCREAIEFLLNLTKLDVKRAVYRYLLYYSCKGYLVESANWESKFNFSNIPREEQITNIADRILERLLPKA